MQRSTRWLLAINIIGSALTALVIVLISLNVKITSFVPFKVFLFAHILGAIIFLGNIVITGAWMVLAERSGSDDVIKFAVRGVNWADVFFTAPGVYLILVAGLSMGQKVGLGKSWLVAAMTIFGLSGVIWFAYLIPVQDKLVRFAQSPAKLGAKFYRTLHRWYFWGLVATVLPLLVLILMVDRPKLW